MRYITVQLFMDDKQLQDADIKWNGVYDVHPSHQDELGTRLQVVAGPHSDFSADGVYTVRLLDPPQSAEYLPYFNQEYRSGYGYSKANVTRVCEREQV